MKNTQENNWRNPLLEIFKKLYDQQFPKTRSCFELEKTEEEIEKIEKDTGLMVSILLKYGSLLVILQGINFFVALKDKGWENSHSFGATLCMIFTLLIGLVAITMIKSQQNTKHIERLTSTQTRNGFEHFRCAREIFLEISDRIIGQNKMNPINTPEKLKDYLEDETQSLAHLIKAMQSRSQQDYMSIKTFDFMGDEKARLKKMVELAAHLGLMNTNNVSVVSDSENGNLIKMRADWIYRKIFEDRK